MHLDDDGDDGCFATPATEPLHKKRKLSTMLQETKTAVLSPTELQCVIEKAKAKIVGAFSAIGTKFRFESSGTGYILRIGDLSAKGVSEEAVNQAIADSGIWASHVILRPATADVAVTFALKQGKPGSSAVSRQVTRYGEGALHGVRKVERDRAHKLLVASLVPSPQDRSYLTIVIDYWENYRGPDQTPRDVYWQLQCLDGTMIDSKTGESKKIVGGTATAATAAGDGSSNNNKYKLFVFGLEDALLPELRAAKEKLSLHCLSPVLDPKLHCFTQEIMSYASGGFAFAFTKPVVEYEQC